MESTLITVWGRKSSSNVQALLWCLAELGIDYERIDAGFIYGVTDTPAYLQMNPNGTVPTLQDGPDLVLYETGAMLRYLASNYGDDAFWPREVSARAKVDMWAEWAKINIAMNFTTPLFWLAVRVEPAKRDPLQIQANYHVLEQYLRIANDQLAESEFLAANHLTLADIQLGHVLYRYFDIEIPRTEFTHLQRYYNTLSARAAFQRTVMLPYDELRDSK